MRELFHPNLVQLRHCFFTSGEKKDEDYMNIVMEYVPKTVQQVLKECTSQKKQMPPLLVKVYAY